MYQQAVLIGRLLITTDPHTVMMSKQSICVPGDLFALLKRTVNDLVVARSIPHLGGCHTPPRWLLRTPRVTRMQGGEIENVFIVRLADDET